MKLISTHLLAGTNAANGSARAASKAALQQPPSLPTLYYLP